MTMTADEARYILDLLGPLDSTRRCIMIKNGRLAVVILDEPANISRDELAVACRLHGHFESCLLVVL
jgi:hypothetical protein